MIDSLDDSQQMSHVRCRSVKRDPIRELGSDKIHVIHVQGYGKLRRTRPPARGTTRSIKVVRAWITIGLQVHFLSSIEFTLEQSQQNGAATTHPGRRGQ